MPIKQPLFDFSKISKDLIESNSHVDWSAEKSLDIGCDAIVNAVLGSDVSDDTGIEKRPPGYDL